MSAADGSRVPNFRVSRGSPEGDAFSLNGEERFWLLMAKKLELYLQEERHKGVAWEGGLVLRSELSAGSGLHLLRGNPGCLSCCWGWLAVGQGWMWEEDQGPLGNGSCH